MLDESSNMLYDNVITIANRSDISLLTCYTTCWNGLPRPLLFITSHSTAGLKTKSVESSSVSLCVTVASSILLKALIIPMFLVETSRTIKLKLPL